MKEVDFPEWREALKQAELPERLNRSFEITLGWYLSYCRRGRSGVNHQSARDFIEWAEREKNAEAWQVEQWREAIRWFFRGAKGAAKAAEGTTSGSPEAKADGIQEEAVVRECLGAEAPRHQNRLDQLHQREPVGDGPILMAGRFWRFFLFSLATHGCDSLHLEPSGASHAEGLS